MTFDLAIRNGRLVDESGERLGDVAVRGGRIAVLGDDVGRANTDIDADGRYVIPGGIDSHVHMGQLSSKGDMTADDFATGSRSAAWGGTTTLVPFAAQHRGMSATEVLEEALDRAGAEMCVDYGMHLIVTDLSGDITEALARVASSGTSALKIYLTYDRLKLDAEAGRELMTIAAAHGLPVMVHAEDDGIVSSERDAELAAGRVGARSHAASHSRAAEWSGTAQAINLAEATGASLYLVHLSTPAAVDLAVAARQRGTKITVETCPHYLLLDEAVYDAPIEAAAPFMCSPPLRGDAERRGLMSHIRTQAIDVVASDHSPYTVAQKLPHGPETRFTESANGLPGVELRLALLYTALVKSGAGTMRDLVRLGCSGPAAASGMFPRKGSLRVGSDADLVVWDDTPWTVSYEELHDNVGYTPYAGMELAGRAATVVSRGEVILQDGTEAMPPGRGRFIPRSG